MKVEVKYLQKLGKSSYFVSPPLKTSCGLKKRKKKEKSKRKKKKAGKATGEVIRVESC